MCEEDWTKNRTLRYPDMHSYLLQTSDISPFTTTGRLIFEYIGNHESAVLSIPKV